MLHGLGRSIKITFGLAFAMGIALPPAYAKAPWERDFYEVVKDVVGDFEYDLRDGSAKGVQNISLRNITTSENIPASFRDHLEVLINESIVNNTKSKVIQCIACRAKRATLTGSHFVVKTPETNPTELARIAKEAGIEHFLDAVFTFQSTSMILSLTISDPKDGTVVWTRNYNSETSRAAAFRRGIDYSQSDLARRVTEYAPSIQYRGVVYYLSEPNVTGLSGCVGAGFRMVQRYDNRKKEIGFEADYIRNAATLSGTVTGASGGSSSDPDLYGMINLTLLFVHSWNFIANKEDFDKVRGNILVGVGGTYSAGYMGGLIRTGWEWRLAKHFAVNAVVGFRPSSTAMIGAKGTTISGAEIGAGINLLY
ncbi:hypothetical protein WDW37_13430 [Bdellovibrionota bacterium FG-1]